MQRNNYLRAALAAGLAVSALSACGGGSSTSNNLSLGGSKTVATSSSPTASVITGVKALGKDAGLQLVLSLSGSPSALVSSSSKLTIAQAQAILDTQLVISTHTVTGSPLSQSTGAHEDGDFQIALVSGGANLATFEVLGKTLYARVDINKTAQTYGLTKGKAEQDQQELQAAGATVPGLSALSAGQWVSLDLTPLLQLEQQSANTSTTTAGSAVSPATAQALATAFVNAFEQNSQITAVGPLDGGSEYQAVVREKALVTALSQATASIPGFSSETKKIDASTIPATQTLTVDAVIKNGVLADLSLPLNQFDQTHELKGPLALDLALSPAPTITAPAGATAINISGILSDLGALKSSASTSAGV